MTSPTFDKILVAVDDSPAALAAVHAAVGVAAGTGACLRFVTVLGDGELVRALASEASGGRLRNGVTGPQPPCCVTSAPRPPGPASPPGSAQLEGQPAALLLSEARDWGADLIVIGRSA